MSAASDRAGAGRHAAYPAWMPAGAIAASATIAALAATWRMDLRGIAAWDAELARGARCIFAVWHARVLPLVWSHRGRAVVVVVSRHRDGEWIARVIQRFGFGAARGSSTRGGDEAMRGMLAAAAAGRLIGMTPDGPRGPAERVKPGIAWLASRTGLPVVPIGTASDRAHAFGSWDRFRLPLPFARVVVGYGDPIAVPAGLADAELDSWRARIEADLTAVTARVAAAAGESPPAPMRSR